MVYAHLNGSFSYKTINEEVKKVLNSRSDLDNRIQVGQPFVKVTSALRLKEVLGQNNLGFTLGLHAIPEDVSAENIYSNVDGDALIGYTYTADGKTERVYAKLNSEIEKANTILDNNSELLNTTRFSRIPPPGITSVTIGRNRAGVTSYAQITFSVPTQSQLEMLHRTLLIPGIGVVVEWGQQFADTDPSFYGQSGNIKEHMFPWYDREKLLRMMTRLGNNEVGLEEIFKNYVIPSQGQYMWIFGRVANFSIKSNGDGSFEGTMKIIGPSENAWAYTVRNTVVPPRSSNGVICADSVNSIESFFTNTTSGTNLSSLLQRTQSQNPDDADLAIWKNHVLKFDKPNRDNGEKTSEPNASESSFADSEDSYFMTWRFFVNVVLNSDKYGLKKIFLDAKLEDDESAKAYMLRPYTVYGDDGSSNINVATPYIDDPYENFVGNNQFLRSVDPGTMIIVNEKAVQLASQDLSQNRPGLVNELTRVTELSNKFASQGDFYTSARSVTPDRDKGFLSTGVWINHKAVVQAMISADTALAGISNLLQRMSAATMNFWQLSIDVSEPMETPAAPLSYAIADINYRENSNLAVEKFVNKVHVFNKYVKSSDNKILGSDVLECNIDLNLPKRLFSQIATLGLVQSNDIDKNNPESPVLSGANETFRKLFAITSISDRDPDGLGPDISLPVKKRNAVDACGGANGQTTAQTAGSGNQSSPVNVIDVTATAEDTETQIKSLETDIQANCTGSCLDQINSITTTLDNSALITTGSITYEGVQGTGLQVVTIDKDFRGNRTNTNALWNRGYRNGRIPRNNLQRINQGNHRLYKDAADKFMEMAAAALEEGVSLNVSDSYRPIEQQIALIPRKGAYSKAAPLGTPADTARYPNGLGATPGTSNHGWGLAVDLNRGENFNQTLSWLQSNAGTYGFTTIPGEPWHWEYVNPIPQSTIPQIVSDPDPPAPVAPNVTQTTVTNTTPECSECVRKKILLNQLRLQQQNNSSYDRGRERVVRDFPMLEQVMRYIEPYGDLMVANITRSSDGNQSNAFGAAPGALSIDAEIVLPGVAGLRVGELFWIDRIPTYYKVFGAFQILGIEEVINGDGWKTRINAKFNYLGEKWKQAMETLLLSRGLNID